MKMKTKQKGRQGSHRDDKAEEVTMIPIVSRVLGMVLKGLENRLGELEIRGRIKTIQTTAMFNQIRILRRVLE